MHLNNFSERTVDSDRRFSVNWSYGRLLVAIERGGRSTRYEMMNLNINIDRRAQLHFDLRWSSRPFLSSGSLDLLRISLVDSMSHVVHSQARVRNAV
jgi:hypothetical protein